MSRIETDGGLGELNKLEDNEENLRKLREQFESPLGIVPFVGAGLSIPCGVPGWTAFLEQIAERTDELAEVRGMLAADKYEEAAELIAGALGPQQFADLIDTNYGDGKIRTKPLSGPVLQIPQLAEESPVLTTNFDHILERAFAEAGRPFSEKVWGAKRDMYSQALTQNKHYLIKIHGDVLDREERVLTLSDYEKHYGQRRAEDVSLQRTLPRLLTEVFNQRTLLFVGCSLVRDRTVRLLERVAKKSLSAPTHYAIVELPSNRADVRRRAKELSYLKVRPIWFPTGRYETIDLLLRLIESPDP